ncbi:Apoptotic chromatin condensation inducer in the nucleus [Podila clonocystis]|nr:Apoptotic chromatin condensation inducer in the nucleus [Podila clonocystis]
MIDFDSLKVTELKAELTARGLSTKGLKKELVARLEEAYTAEELGSTATATEPDVAPKPTDNNDTDAGMSKDEQSTKDEAEKITSVVEPVPEPKAAPAEMDIVMAPAPVAAPKKHTGSDALNPVIGTPALSQEGLVDTTMTAPSKKRSLQEAEGEAGSGNEPSKKLRPLENRQDIIAAATASVEADARRRSAAPSPSPAPNSAAATARSTSTSSIVLEEDSNMTGSPTEERKTGAPERRIDARSLMEKQVKQAAMDRHHDEPTSEESVPQSPKASRDHAGENGSGNTKRALVITNFVRPLTVNQVKRMLAEFGEVEVLWMDNIRTHCYVTYKEPASAHTAFEKVDGYVFPKETGKALHPLLMTSEMAAKFVEDAEAAQKAGQRPVIFTGAEPVPAIPATVVPPRRRSVAVAPEPAPPKPVIQEEETEDVFKKSHTLQSPELQAKCNFKMTTAKPALYYKPAKEPPSVGEAAPAAEVN